MAAAAAAAAPDGVSITTTHYLFRHASSTSYTFLETHAQPSKADDKSSTSAEASKVVANDASTISPSIIDMDIFAQLLEMDDDDEQFSKEIVWNYFEQAGSTFAKMDKALGDKDLPELSDLGHFLKGSSAAVGVIKVRDSCECMQHYGKKADKDGITVLSEEDAVHKLTTTLKDVKSQYKEAEETMRRFYDDFDDA